MPLGFLAKLGAMSLIGMMINNSNVLLEEIDADKTPAHDVGRLHLIKEQHDAVGKPCWRCGENEH